MKNKNILSNVKNASSGLLTGIINGFLGSGGGVVAVFMLEKICKLNEKKAHATSVFVIMVLCIFSGFLYISQGEISIKDVIIYIPGGIVGGAIGALLLKKIKTEILKILFGLLMIYSGIRMFF
ncbi:MAG: sulfite exporter TauE/SafE family protein [Clostridia bacterium]|nr:sulfite exporter TauE/SafE family protein [Clostridia bacterium]